MTDQTLILIISAVVTGLTSLITLVFTLTERSRNHAQQIASQAYREKLAIDLEITKLATAEAAKQSELIKIDLVKDKEVRATQIKDLNQNIVGAIDKNTLMNENALNASNDVNIKMQSLGIQLAEQKGESRGLREAHMEAKMEAKNVSIDAKSVEIHAESPLVAKDETTKVEVTNSKENPVPTEVTKK